MLLQMFRTMLSDNTELSDEKIAGLADTFMNTLPVMLKTQLQMYLSMIGYIIKTFGNITRRL